MVRPSKDVTDAELEILQVLWETPGCTIREVVDQLYEDPTRANYQTSKKLVARLEVKGFVRRDNSQTAHVFKPIVGQNELIERRLNDVAASLCEGSTLPLLTCLLQGKSLSARERQRLRDLFAELTQNKSKRGQK